MDAHVREKLIKMETLVPLESGEQGVPVSLQYQPRLNVRSRKERRHLLREAFEEVAQTARTQGAELDLDSLSVSGQTIEACLPLDRFDEIEQDLKGKNIRVDILVDRQIV